MRPASNSGELWPPTGAVQDLSDDRDEEHRGEEQGREPDEDPDDAHEALHRRRPEPPPSSRMSGLRKRTAPTTLCSVPDSFKEFEATSLFCARCRRATSVRKKLLLVLPTGNKYDYTCSECGSAVGGKTDSDPRDFHATARGRPLGRPRY